MMNNFRFQNKITKEEIYQLPLKQFDGNIHYVDTLKKCDEVIKLINGSEILGFDTESKPSFRKGKNNPVSLLQLSDEKNAFLFRINQIGIPDNLKSVLEDRSIAKIGVAIKDDILGLKKIRPFSDNNFIELQQHVKNFGIEDNALKKLTANILNFRISKKQQVTNWEQSPLTPAQQEYAATDAWVCYMMYVKLNGFRIK